MRCQQGHKYLHSVTFYMQMQGAFIFFFLPLVFILTTIAVDVGNAIPGPLFAVLRFTSVMLLELNAPQFGLVFILRNATHRKILVRRLKKLFLVDRLRPKLRSNAQPALTWDSARKLSFEKYRDQHVYKIISTITGVDAIRIAAFLELIEMLRYGLDWDRDYFVEIVFRLNSVLPIISSLTIYPANFYLLVGGPAMNGQLRKAYLVNLVAHAICDFIFTTIVRAYGFPPYGLFYAEGWLRRAGFSKAVNMGVLASGFVMVITAFYILMMRMHQLTIADSTSRWKLSRAAQLAIYLCLAGICAINLAGFVIFGTDVENYEELVQNPELAWLARRGGAVMLFGEPGKASRFRIGIMVLCCMKVKTKKIRNYILSHIYDLVSPSAPVFHGSRATLPTQE
ncbi:hypothetical protein PRIPAC_78853 [Pristionchus pacificus]|uniref:G protein-coupled receptor n=1 Tax=Pristionchus pacificus TaxID=54126 RepID=A0A2A6CJF4_PRIPA|nr:hypothetical protein PRIPAC_78853 [Pristionchus pacificus]|eukprot:PDM78207.1 G protein-coupled receptor [Pristionchus pacificus]